MLLVQQGGNTALLWAAGNGQLDCMRLLLDAGADKDAKSNVRRALSVGAFFLKSIGVTIRIVCNVLVHLIHNDVSAQPLFPAATLQYSQRGWTAMMYAARDGHANCVHLLLDVGADKNATNEVNICDAFMLSFPHVCDSLDHFVSHFDVSCRNFTRARVLAVWRQCGGLCQEEFQV